MDDEYMWNYLPTIEDYFDVDEINDIEETEKDFYKASEEFGW